MAKAKITWEGAAELRSLLVPLGTLELDPENVRVHDARSIEALMRSLQRFGQQKTVVTYAGYVIAGNGTLAAARQLGWTHLAAKEFEGTAAEAHAYAIADNRTAELSAWNESALLETLRDYEERDAATLRDLGFVPEDVTALAGQVAARGQEDNTPQPPRPQGEARILYTIVFEQGTDKAVWDGFRKLLQTQYPEHPTDSKRILAHVSDVLRGLGEEV